MSTRRLVAGNWKMHGRRGSLAVLDAVTAQADALAVDLLVCPPATLIDRFASRAVGSPVAIGGQTCHPDPEGAVTGEISAEMLADCGAEAVILGHSERRQMGERDGDIAARVVAAWRAGLTAVLCVGETAQERAGGGAEALVAAQLAASLPDRAGQTPVAGPLVVAYEPVWAIGTGAVPTPDEIAAMHAALRERLIALGAGPARILYGGSVKPQNAAQIFAVPGVDGALVGGASLDAAQFLAIAAAAQPSNERA